MAGLFVISLAGMALAEEITLKIWIAAPEENETRVWNEIAEAFQTQNPGIKIDLTTKIEWGRPFFQKMQNRKKMEEILQLSGLLPE